MGVGWVLAALVDFCVVDFVCTGLAEVLGATSDLRLTVDSDLAAGGFSSVFGTGVSTFASVVGAGVSTFGSDVGWLFPDAGR